MCSDARVESLISDGLVQLRADLLKRALSETSRLSEAVPLAERAWAFVACGQIGVAPTAFALPPAPVAVPVLPAPPPPPPPPPAPAEDDPEEPAPERCPPQRHAAPARIWEPEDEETLIAMVKEGRPRLEIAERLDREKTAVHTRISNLRKEGRLPAVDAAAEAHAAPEAAEPDVVVTRKASEDPPAPAPETPPAPSDKPVEAIGLTAIELRMLENLYEDLKDGGKGKLIELEQIGSLKKEVYGAAKTLEAAKLVTRVSLDGVAAILPTPAGFRAIGKNPIPLPELPSQRKCLRCERPFTSSGKGNRLCPRCATE